MITRISFRCSEDVKPILSAAATRVPDEKRPFPYKVGEAGDIETDENYVSIRPCEEKKATKDEAIELVNLIHKEAGEPKLEAILWTSGNGLDVVSL